MRWYKSTPHAKTRHLSAYQQRGRRTLSAAAAISLVSVYRPGSALPTAVPLTQSKEPTTSGAMEAIVSQPERAEQSCASCKRLKRRCSKDLPTCELCSRVGRRCNYSTTPSTPTRSDTEPRNERIQSRTDTPASFPFRSDVSLNSLVSNIPTEETSDLATCFLDSVATRGMDVALPQTLLWLDVCPGSYDICKDEASNIIDRYFSTTHSWLPISMFLQDISCEETA